MRKVLLDIRVQERLLRRALTREHRNPNASRRHASERLPEFLPATCRLYPTKEIKYYLGQDHGRWGRAMHKQKEKSIAALARWQSVSGFALPPQSSHSTSCLSHRCCHLAEAVYLCCVVGKEAGGLGTYVWSHCCLTGRTFEWVKMRQFCPEQHAWRHGWHVKERNLQPKL